MTAAHELSSRTATPRLPTRDAEAVALRDMKILIVDDEPTNVALLESILEEQGFSQLLMTSDARFAASYAREFAPDIVLLDLMMPHVSGLEVMQQLAADRAVSDFVPVMVLTADATDATKKSALAAGATDFLTKPFDAVEVILRITNLLRTRCIHLALAAQNGQLEIKVHERTVALERTIEELQQTQQAIVQKERLSALGEMVTGIAHDFNNALALILGYGELLQQELREHPKPEFGEYTETMVLAARDAAEIVTRLREFHRPPEPGEASTPLSMNDLVEQAVLFTRPRWEAESRGCGLPVEVKTDLAELPALAGSASELREMLTNLIFNALDAMPQGGTISLRTRALGERIELAVTDTGTGMSDEVRRRCLEPFFSTKGARGSGLGLAMVYGIVERHGGTVEIASALGRGTTFVFTFPRDRSGATAGAEEAHQPSRPLRILVVDDQPVQCEILSYALEKDWHQVAVAANGREALDRFEREEFDLVITDKAMPEMNGDQLAIAIKAREPETRVIMLTGFGTPLDSETDRSEFIDLFIAKPASRMDLRAGIAKVMA